MTKELKNNKKSTTIAILAIVTLVALLIILISLFGPSKTSLTVSQSLGDNFIDNRTKLSAYSAESPTELLYENNSNTALIDNGNISYAWEIPDEFRNRDTYIELIIKSEKDDEEYITCTYYVSNNSKGLLANIFGWNKLGDGQKVGCADGARYKSFISAKRDVEDIISEISKGDILFDKKQIEEIVKEITVNEKVVLNNYIVTPGARGQEGSDGKDGRDGRDGKDGKDGSGEGSVGPQGPRGEKGDTGQKGDAGDRGEKGDRGDKGDQGDPGRDGLNGSNGQDGINGRDGLDGSNGIDGVDGVDGQNGKSAYEIWLDLGNEGTEQDFINSLKGEDGDNSEGQTINVTGGGLEFDNINLSLKPCSEGQILKVVSGLYACSNDNYEAYTAGSGLTLSSNNVFSINITECRADQGNKLTYEADSGFVCAPDEKGQAETINTQTLSWNTGTRELTISDGNTITIGDQDTTYIANENLGLVLNNGSFELKTCQDNQILKFTTQNIITGEWACSEDNDTKYDLSSYLQISNLQTAIASLTPGYYNKNEIDSRLQTLMQTIPGGGLLVPVEIDKESSLPSDLTDYSAGYHWYIQDMDLTQSGRTGRAWVYQDTDGNKSIYRTIDQYLSPDSTTIITNGNGQLTVSTAWITSNLGGYVNQSNLPVCSNSQYLAWDGSNFACRNDKDTITLDTNTTYAAGNGLKLSGTNAFSIDSSTCKGAANKLTYDETSGFICETDQVNNQLSIQSLTYNSGAGTISISGGNTISLAQYTAGSGLRLDGQQFSINLPSACASNQKLTWNGTNFQCALDRTTEPLVCHPFGYVKYETWDDMTVVEDGQNWLRMNGQELKTADYPEIQSVFVAGDSIVTPAMTSNTLPSPFVADQSSHWTASDNYRAFLAFNRTSSGIADGWASGSGQVTNQWASIKLPEERTVGSYALKSRAIVEPGSAPRDFRIEGSNDGTNWDVLDRRTGITWANMASEVKRFNITNPGSYSHYRLFVETRLGSNQYIMISELELYNQDTNYKNLPVRPNNAQGLKAYVKASGECPRDKSQVESGSTTGYTLTWNGDEWVETGALQMESLTANTITGNMFNIKQITDSKGSTGNPGQQLTIGNDGEVIWQ